jgi:HlyD family secretion protein
MKKKLLLPGLATVVLATASYFLFFKGTSQKFDFRYDNVSTGDVTMYVTATGTVNPVTSVDVGTQVSGIISTLYADYNSVVKKGQVIAQIDSTFLVQAVKDAEANLDKAKAQYADSKRNLDREKALFARGLDSQLNYDAAVTTYESNSAGLKSAQSALDRAKINGVVINRAVNVGQTVAASFSSPTLYTIANDLSKMQVLATVDESDIGTVSIGQEASFTVDAYPDETFQGKISQIRLAPVSIQNVVNYTVVIDVNNQNLKLMPGMTANVKILVASSHDVLRVPNMALRFQPPTEVIDTTKFHPRRGLMAMEGEGGEMQPAVDPASGQNGGGADGRRARFIALRDSIQAAHGGTLSPEDLRNEMQKFFGNRPAKKEQVAMKQIRPPRATDAFGITQRFPEYEKSAYVPQHQAGRGRVWVVDSTGKLSPVFVRTGVTDGKYTEITTSKLNNGDRIVMGVDFDDGGASQARNPFTQQSAGGRRGFR